MNEHDRLHARLHARVRMEVALTDHPSVTNKPSPRRGRRPITGSRLRVMVHELNVRRLELEMQNEALRDARVEREALNARYAELFEFVPVGLLCLDVRGRIDEVNPAATHLLGAPRDKACGKPFVTFLASEDVSPFLNHLLSCGKTGGTASVDVRVGAADGGRVPVRLNTTMLRDEAESTVRYRTAIIDLAPLLAAQKDREIASEERARRAEAEAANRAKSAFLATVTHELRTPLTSILGFGQLLLAGAGSAEERARHLRTLVRNGEQLLHIVNDILDMAKVEASHLEVEAIEVDVLALLAEILESLSPQARVKGIALRSRVSGPVPARFTTDPARLRQVLENVISNAVKFTEAGLVEVVVHSAAEGSPRPRRLVQFSVRDTGVGIPVERCSQIFEPFEQGDPSTSRRFGGTGLGLALSRRLALLLGGNVVLASSQPGHGSTFVVSVEALNPRWSARASSSELMATPALPASQAMPSSCAPLAGRRVLVVEDSRDIAEYVCLVLRALGSQVDVAANGIEGSGMALARPYDVILMDLQMPVQDGTNAARSLRERGYKRPIVALTADPFGPRGAAAGDATFDGFVTKPFDKDELGRLVASFDRAPTLPLQ